MVTKLEDYYLTREMRHHEAEDYRVLRGIRQMLESDLQREIEKLRVRRMLTTYRSTSSAKPVAVVKSEKKTDHHVLGKGQPILPDVAQIVLDAKTGKRYFRGRLLGKGGFARCYEVTDMQTDKKMACKAIAKARISKPHQQQKIANEVELHRNLNGQYIVGFHAYFEDSENVYMLLELCSRKSLVQLLKQRRTLTEPEVRYFLRQLIEGVRYLHKERIIHRDIKLGNLFINNDMQIRIGDFGLAVRAGPDGKKETSVCGTPNYIAPEVLSKTGHSYEVDTWAIGCVMYTLLVGRPPFETSCLKDTYMRIRNNEYAIPSRVSRPAAKLIQKLLSERPEERPALDTVLSDEFFTRGFTPKLLPSMCCVSPPKFTSAKCRTLQKQHSRCPALPAADEHSNTGSLKDALERISLKECESLQQKDDLGESGIDSQGSHGEEEDERNACSSEIFDESSGDYHNPQTLCTRLSACLNAMPDANSTGKSDPISTGTSDSEDDHNSTGYESQTSDQCSRKNHLWITKWVDYSNKYGFGAQLSNGSIVIRYNDGTTLAVDALKRRLQYFDEDRNIFRFSINNIPEDLSRKVTLLNYFSNYMDKHLLKGGDLDDGTNERETFSEISIIDIWFRTDKAMVMYLSDGTLQVNFLADHTKIILNPEEKDDIVTFINQNRESCVTSLREISKRGCKESVNERLQYCLMVLHKLTEMYLDDMN